MATIKKKLRIYLDNRCKSGQCVISTDTPAFKVNKLEIDPGKSTSLHKHTYISEHWVIVQGIAEVCVNGTQYTLKEDDTFSVFAGTIHKLTNTSNDVILKIIEVQTGPIISGDDIIRYGQINES